jgi:hypothetical protein
MLGPKVYDHVRELKALGLINARRKGSTLELTTTQRFPEYFGIESAKREDIKRFMAERAGIELGASEPPSVAMEATGDEGTEPEGAEPEGAEPEGAEPEGAGPTVTGPETPDIEAQGTEPEEDQV